MNAGNLISGIILIIVGVSLLIVGPQLIVVPSTQIQVSELFHDETFLVGDVAERSAQLDEGVTVNGTVAVSSALTGAPSHVLMFVTDDANYQKWIIQGSPTYVFQKDLSNGQTFSFTVSGTSLHHFVFDNKISLEKKKVTLTADLQKPVTVNISDKRISYVAYAVVAAGCLFAVMGILRRTQVRWA